MPAQLTTEVPVIRAPEEAAIPKPVEKPKQPVGLAEEKMAQAIDPLGDGKSRDPDKSFQDILNISTQGPPKSNVETSNVGQPNTPREASQESSEAVTVHQNIPENEETSAYRITLQTLSEKIAQEADPTVAAKLRQEMANVVADYIPRLPNDRATAFIAEFNQNNPGLLKSQEFRLLHSQGEKIIMVDESGNLREMVVTKENARSTLGEIKDKDETLRGNSYGLRKEIVRRSNGEITTHEAYTYPLVIPKGNNLDAFLDNPDNWVPERRALQQQIIDQEYAKTLALSARLGDPEPTVYALRGNTAAGKTTAIKKDELFRRALDEDGQPSGAINPDTYKTELKSSEVVNGKQAVGHQQAHEEGSMIARKISGKIADSESSMVIDKRMNKAKNITELIALAERYGKGVKILDVDVPLETSLIRVLGRKIGGKDPTVPFDAVTEGFEGVRQNRAALIEQVINNPKIKDYALYVTDESGASIKAAQKVNGEFMVIEGQENAFQRATSKNTESTVVQMASTVIDEAYIEGVINSTPEVMQPKIRTSLERYKGRTMKEALDLHAQKLNEDE